MLSVSTITMKSDDPRTTARFWRDLLGYTIGPNHSDSILLVGDGPSLLIQPTSEATAPGAIHLDLRPDDHEAAVEFALSLGAQCSDIGQSGDEGWTVLADTAGNLFCILESADDHASRRACDPGTPTHID